MEMDQPQPVEVSHKEILSLIDLLKKEVANERCNYIKRKIEENKQNLVVMTNQLYQSSKEINMNGMNDTNDSTNLLEKRRRDAIGMHNCIDSSVERESNTSEGDDHSSTAVLLGSSIPVRNAVRPIKLPAIQRLPPYTTWTFLNRNQRMTEDQSVVGRRRIYYDQNGGEALICSDSEEEHIEEEEEKKLFLQSEDYILRNTVEKFGLLDQVLDLLAQCFCRTTVEVKDRYDILVKSENAVKGDNKDATEAILDKDLDAALDSFDNLFCRRCLVFDCRLHGCSQDLVFPAEKPPPWSLQIQENTSCGPNCYRMVLMPEKSDPLSEHGGVQKSSKIMYSSQSDRSLKTCQSGSPSIKDENAVECVDSGTELAQDTTSVQLSSPAKSKLAGKSGSSKRNSKRVAERIALCLQKRQKKMAASNLDSTASEVSQSTDTNFNINLRKESEDANSSSYKSGKPQTSGQPQRKESPTGKVSVEGDIHDGPSTEMKMDLPTAGCDETLRKEKFVGENVHKEISDHENYWKTLEISLLDKGIEIFGRNSCLIAKNILDGMKTCWQIYQYMNCSENKLSSELDAHADSLTEGNSKGNGEVRRRSRFLRRRGKVRRLKYSWKTAAYNSIKKRISERKDQPCRQYNPCNCQGPCGKQCPCLQNGTCCEKYCGCPKHCKIRFRGCHCAKSQCRSRQCPCFAADRECDPDVCRNCWVSSGGDGSLGVPNQRGDNYECRNMKLLLKQQQRVLLGRSDVSGWGAFLKNNVAKHEYLGEYTGELISHREADKRGKIYDRENSSFLFNLNDKFVLDAYRKGDKLKFANHSPDPNCYAKVMMVAGDHRVGIFAKERINAGEELFYDYRYDPDRAPVWARKPDAAGSRKDDGAPSSGRARKHT